MKKILHTVKQISIFGSLAVLTFVALFSTKDKNDQSRHSLSIFTIAQADYVGEGGGGDGACAATGSTSSDSCTGPGTDAGGGTGNASSTGGGDGNASSSE